MFLRFVTRMLAAAGVVVVVLALVFMGLVAAPPDQGKIVMATGSSHYYDLAESYRRDLERNGVRYEVQRRTEGFATLRALADSKSGINAGFVKGGLMGSLQGRLATTKAKGRHAEYAKLRSIGRLFYEPIWVFTRGDLPITSLRDLENKRILVGTRESGTRRIATQLLRANGLDQTNATLIDEELLTNAGQLTGGDADAAILILPADAEKIQKLLRVPDIRLMDFTPEADAYTNRFPALTRVVLRRGSVEFNPLIPTDDITLLATTVALVVRSDMDAALVSLLTHAVISNPRPGFDQAGDPVLFYRAGEFPSANDPEFEVASDARVLYKSGELPFLLRVLAPINKWMGLPFSVTSLAHSHGGKLVLLIPMLAIIWPLTRALPALYVWNIRRRLVYWYGQLKALERRMESVRTSEDAVRNEAELERIDAAVRRIRIPVYFADQVYDLRGHIDLVRQRIAAKPVAAKLAAE
jgi:TRAP-type uncharacterized transport system substrate-binding protein